MNLLIIGDGYMGNKHKCCIQRINKHIKVIVCKSDNDFESIIATTKVNGAIICTPYDRHFSIAQRILSKKIPVFVEKPLAENYCDAKKLVDLFEKQGTPLIVGQILRYFEAFKQAQTIIQQGSLGKIHLVHCTRFSNKEYSIRKWWCNLERFLLLYEGIHTLDWLFQVFSIDKLQLQYSKLYNESAFIFGDTRFRISLSFLPGMEVLVEHDMFSSISQNIVTIYGTKGYLSIKDFHALDINGVTILSSTFEKAFDAALERELSEFIGFMNGYNPSICLAASALPAFLVIETAYKCNEAKPRKDF